MSDPDPRQTTSMEDRITLVLFLLKSMEEDISEEEKFELSYVTSLLNNFFDRF